MRIFLHLLDALQIGCVCWRFGKGIPALEESGEHRFHVLNFRDRSFCVATKENQKSSSEHSSAELHLGGVSLFPLR